MENCKEKIEHLRVLKNQCDRKFRICDWVCCNHGDLLNYNGHKYFTQIFEKLE